MWNGKETNSRQTNVHSYIVEARQSRPYTQNFCNGNDGEDYSSAASGWQQGARLQQTTTSRCVSTTKLYQSISTTPNMLFIYFTDFQQPDSLTQKLVICLMGEKRGRFRPSGTNVKRPGDQFTPNQHAFLHSRSSTITLICSESLKRQRLEAQGRYSLFVVAIFEKCKVD
jgi:hypothetical protein